MKMPIDPNREYKPMEIYKYGFILNTVGLPDYRYTLRLIQAGKLRARNVCRGVNKYYLVKGSDIIIWKNSTYNIERQKEVYVLKPEENKPLPQGE